MTEMSVTEFARNMRNIFDRIEHNKEEIILIRNHHRIARILPGSSNLTAIEAMSDLYKTLPDDAAQDWLKDSKNKKTLDQEMKNKWDS